MLVCRNVIQIKGLSRRNRKVIIVTILIGIGLLYITKQYENYSKMFNKMFIVNERTVIKDNSSFAHAEDHFLINTGQCKIKKNRLMEDHSLRIYDKIKPLTCRNKKIGLLTYITINNDEVMLHVNQSVVGHYSSLPIKCLYRIVERNIFDSNVDNVVDFSDSVAIFEDSVDIAMSANDKVFTIKVECWNQDHSVYDNIHYIFHPLKKHGMNQESYNVFIIGIDSLSRSSFIRNMPKTYEYFKSNNWMDFKGFNKIGQKTFPNLMAMLTGRNYNQILHLCNPERRSGLINCEFIWDIFKKYGYITAYADDNQENYNHFKKGFLLPPTDYYLKPYFLSLKRLDLGKIHCASHRCYGLESAATRMLNIMKRFSRTIKYRQRGFGVFWMSSFSHNNISCPSSMDHEFFNFFKYLENSQALSETIVIIISDHGLRDRRLSLSGSGWLNERLPVNFFWVPQKFMDQHPQEYTNLQSNTNKLTTPFDLYMTLQHILALTNPNAPMVPCRGCAKCTSLFRVIDDSRTCIEAGIPPQWCVCSNMKNVDLNDKRIFEIAKIFEHTVNHRLIANAEECSVLFIERILSAKEISGDQHYFLVRVKLFPEAIFDILANSVTENKYKLVFIDRLDKNNIKSVCTGNRKIKNYCHCNSVLEMLARVFCNNIYCLM